MSTAILLFADTGVSMPAPSARRIIATIVAAFENDPAVRWLYPDPRQYRAHFPEFVRLFGGRAIDCGTADSGGDRTTAALWLPPGVQPDEPALVAHLQASVAEPHQPAVFALIEQMAQFHPAEPHWHLPFIAVRPAAQGAGLGSALLEHGLRRCDRDRLPAYLESTNPRNQPLYERHGFKALGEIRAGDSPPIIPMLRPAS